MVLITNEATVYFTHSVGVALLHILNIWTLDNLCPYSLSGQFLMVYNFGKKEFPYMRK